MLALPFAYVCAAEEQYNAHSLSPLASVSSGQKQESSLLGAVVHRYWHGRRWQDFVCTSWYVIHLHYLAVWRPKGAM